MTEKRDRTIPRARASAACTRPAGTGRPRVRLIRASISASYHMFREAEAPAPTAMHRMAIAPMTGFSGVPAQIIPVAAVKTTSDMTRGFSSWT